MSHDIHPSAIVSAEARIGAGVKIGPLAVVSAEVEIGDGSWIGPHTRIDGPAIIGRDNLIYGQSALGTDPQDLKFRGERTTLFIGNGNKIREFVTINRGTQGGIQKTAVGNDNLLMTGVHVAHDCEIGNGVILANSATLAGHVQVGDHATVGAFSGVHQFCRVGPFAFVGGYTILTRDALPFVKTVGDRNQAALYGVNTLGLQRKGFSSERIHNLKQAYRLLFRKGLKLDEAIQSIRDSDFLSPDVELLLQFIAGSERGFVRAPGGRGQSTEPSEASSSPRGPLCDRDE